MPCRYRSKESIDVIGSQWVFTSGLLVWLTAMRVPMSAHHSMAMYDQRNNITITGAFALRRPAASSLPDATCHKVERSGGFEGYPTPRID